MARGLKLGLASLLILGCVMHYIQQRMLVTESDASGEIDRRLQAVNGPEEHYAKIYKNIYIQKYIKYKKIPKLQKLQNMNYGTYT